VIHIYSRLDGLISERVNEKSRGGEGIGIEKGFFFNLSSFDGDNTSRAGLMPGTAIGTELETPPSPP